MFPTTPTVPSPTDGRIALTVPLSQTCVLGN